MRVVDAARAFEAWLAPRKDVLTTIAVRGTYLDEEDARRLLALSLPGIDEVAALLEIVRLPAASYEQVVVDTAPTGHTLRLVAMPALSARLAEVLNGLQAHHRDVVRALTGRDLQDAADRLIASLAEDSALLMRRLRDAADCEFVWVTLPEPMALEETSDAVGALAEQGIRVGTLIVNRTTPPGGCEWDAARRRFEARALAPIADVFPHLRLRSVPDVGAEPRGAKALETLASSCSVFRRTPRPSAVKRRLYADPGRGLDSNPVLPPAFDAGWLLFGGKGGVGKTTCSAAVALDLARARPDARFLLLSTDPAHSLGDVLGRGVDDTARPLASGPPNLDVREIDAPGGLQRFRERYRHAVEAMFDNLTRHAIDASSDRSAVRDLIDLAPPGVDEVMAIADVAALLTGVPRYRTIIADTAPTGHALRLLEMPGVLRAWTQALMAIVLKYREVVRPGAFAQLLVDLSKRLKTLEGILRDPARTAFVVVTRPAAIPCEEALALRTSLETLGVAVRAFVVNAVGAGSCRRCQAARARERREVRAFASRLTPAGPYAIIVTPSALPPPHGPEALETWRRRWRAVKPAS